MNYRKSSDSIKYALHVVLPFIVPSRPPVIYAAIYKTLTED